MLIDLNYSSFKHTQKTLLFRSRFQEENLLNTIFIKDNGKNKIRHLYFYKLFSEKKTTRNDNNMIRCCAGILEYIDEKKLHSADSMRSAVTFYEVDVYV